MIDDTIKRKLHLRLRRIVGQLQGIETMIAEDRYSVEILLQLASAQAAIGQVEKLVLQSHVESCVSKAIATGRPTDRKQKMDELIEVLFRYVGPGLR